MITEDVVDVEAGNRTRALWKKIGRAAATNVSFRPVAIFLAFRAEVLTSRLCSSTRRACPCTNERCTEF